MGKERVERGTGCTVPHPLERKGTIQVLEKKVHVREEICGYLMPMVKKGKQIRKK